MRRFGLPGSYPAGSVSGPSSTNLWIAISALIQPSRRPTHPADPDSASSASVLHLGPELEHGLGVHLAHARLGDAQDLPISARVRPSS
jgi:hypothetical protein